MERQTKTEALGTGTGHLAAFEEPVSLARRRQRLRVQRRHRRLRAIGVSVIWLSLVLATVLLVLAQWWLLHLS